MDTMHKTWEHAYAASPDAVFEMLADPAFRSKVCDAQNVVSHEVTIEPEGEGFTMVNDQVQHTAGLPAIAKKFVGDTTRAIQRERWHDRTGGSLVVETPGKPSEIRGTSRLAASANATKQTVELELKFKVPLIGDRLAGMLAEVIGAAITTEFEVGDAWLAGDR